MTTPLARYRAEADTRRLRRAARNRVLLKALTSSKIIHDAFNDLSAHVQASVMLDTNALTKAREAFLEVIESAKVRGKCLEVEDAHDAMHKAVSSHFGADMQDFESTLDYRKKDASIVERLGIDEDDSELGFTAMEQLIIGFTIKFSLGESANIPLAKLRFKLDAILDITHDKDGKPVYSHVRALAMENLVLHEVISREGLAELYRDVLVAIGVPPEARVALCYNWVRQY
jgi:hypothetical protein